MTIYYLCVKTHTITGLKYLCQTRRTNPHKYLGSGTYWRKHLNHHGKTIDTQIIRECKNLKELTHWGLYYSELWNIVKSNEWANLVPESGVGGKTTWGKNSVMKRPEVVAKFSGLNHFTKKPDYNGIHFNKGKDASGRKNSRYDPTIYVFQNIKSKEIEHSTRFDLATKYKLNLGNLSKIFSGKYKHCGGWQLVKN